MQRLGLLDSAFLAVEDEHVALHIGGVAIFAGPAPSYDTVIDRYARAVAAHPLYRRKLRRPALGLTRGGWVDDPAFELTDHLRRIALPRPLDAEEFDDLIGELMSRRLPADRPLWQAVVIEGLAAGRWAVVTKVHHSLVDGLGMMDLVADLFDHRPSPGHQPNARHPQTGRATRLRGARPLPAFLGAAVAAALQPRHTTRVLVGRSRGLRDLASALRPTETNSLVGGLHTGRTYRTARFPMSELRKVQDELGGTVNDIALAVATRGYREVLRHRGEPLAAHSVRCLVPVSTRDAVRSGDAANHVSALLVELPVDYADPTACLGALAARTHRLKDDHEAELGEVGVALAGRLPAPLVIGLLRASKHVPQHVVTTVVTNVPGPRHQVSFADRRLLELYPYVPLAEHIRIAVAVSSYDGELAFGITCDRESMPDADVLLAGMTDGFAELVKAADNVRRP